MTTINHIVRMLCVPESLLLSLLGIVFNNAIDYHVVLCTYTCSLCKYLVDSIYIRFKNQHLFKFAIAIEVYFICFLDCVWCAMCYIVDYIHHFKICLSFQRLIVPAARVYCFAHYKHTNNVNAITKCLKKQTRTGIIPTQKAYYLSSEI